MNSYPLHSRRNHIFCAKKTAAEGFNEQLKAKLYFGFYTNSRFMYVHHPIFLPGRICALNLFCTNQLLHKEATLAQVVFSQ